MTKKLPTKIKRNFNNKVERDQWIMKHRIQGYVLTKLAYNRNGPDNWDVEMIYDR